MKRTGIAALCLLLCTVLAACSRVAGEDYSQVPMPQTTSVPDVTSYIVSSQPVSLPDPVSSKSTVSAQVEDLPMGVYIDSNNGTFPLTTEFTGPFTAGEDIVVFAVMPSAEEALDGQSYREIWDGAKKDYPALAAYKVGFELVLTMKAGGEMRQRVLGPEDTVTALTDYLELYVYDDIHQTPGVWYSHLTPDQVTKDTIMTSCKLTATDQTENVDSITFTAFLYRNDLDFDTTTGQYTGPLQLTVPVHRA